MFSVNFSAELHFTFVGIWLDNKHHYNRSLARAMLANTWFQNIPGRLWKTVTLNLMYGDTNGAFQTRASLFILAQFWFSTNSRDVFDSSLLASG